MNGAPSRATPALHVHADLTDGVVMVPPGAVVLDGLEVVTPPPGGVFYSKRGAVMVAPSMAAFLEWLAEDNALLLGEV